MNKKEEDTKDKEDHSKHDHEIILIYNDADAEDVEKEMEPENGINLPLTDSPLYPRLYLGNSPEQLQSEFDEVGYVDQNVSRTWTGLLSNIYG